MIREPHRLDRYCEAVCDAGGELLAEILDC
jgi:phytoene/squalene synthetase